MIPDNGLLTIDSGSNLEVGDILLDSTQNKLIVKNISCATGNEKYVLLTKAGTVLASDLYVTTLCNEEVSGGEKLFGQTMDNWKERHFSDDTDDFA